MDKIMGKVIDVSREYKLKVDSAPDWLEPIEKVKQYINRDLIGKDVDLALEQGKVIFVKILGNGSEPKNDELIHMLKSINLNLGSLAIMNKINLLFDLETKDWNKEQCPELKLVYDYLKGDIGKYVNSLKNIKKEQDVSV
jgi:hypothetical protein